MNKKIKRFSISALAIVLLGSYSYNLIKGTVDAEILEDNENELFLRYKMSDAVDATKNDAGEAQELMYADYKSERESIGATCN